MLSQSTSLLNARRSSLSSPLPAITTYPSLLSVLEEVPLILSFQSRKNPTSISSAWTVFSANFHRTRRESPLLPSLGVPFFFFFSYFAELLRPGGTLLVSEAGTRWGFHLVRCARSLVLRMEAESKRATVLAPCPHCAECPLQDNRKNWCRFAQQCEPGPTAVGEKGEVHGRSSRREGGRRRCFRMWRWRRERGEEREEWWKRGREVEGRKKGRRERGWKERCSHTSRMRMKRRARQCVHHTLKQRIHNTL